MLVVLRKVRSLRGFSEKSTQLPSPFFREKLTLVEALPIMMSVTANTRNASSAFRPAILLNKMNSMPRAIKATTTIIEVIMNSNELSLPSDADVSGGDSTALVLDLAASVERGLVSVLEL